jgi:kumamolisin
MALHGSERKPLPGAHIVGAPSPDERIAVTLRLRASKPLTTTQPMYTHAQYEAEHGAATADIALVEQFAQEHSLDVLEISTARRTVRLSGTVANLQTAFGVTLQNYEHPGGAYRGREGTLTLPEPMHEAVTAVLGLDNRPAATPHFRTRDNATNGANPAFTPPQLAQLYSFPQGATGSGQTIGILELGGGFSATDLTTYFQQLGLTVPSVVAVSVDGAHNIPNNPDGNDGEVLLDIEVAGAVAPGASIAVYFTTNTDAGFLDALTTAIHDNVHKPSVISISWGGPEEGWTDQARSEFDQALQAAAALGVTVCVAAGDSGSYDIPANDPSYDGQAHVDFPASNPWVLACGGTTVTSDGATITSEVVWNELANNEGATGGGISDKYAVPDYQQGLLMPPSANAGAGPGRGVPDVCGDADPTTGYQVLVDGTPTVVGGTSAVAPLWAGLIACLNQQLGRNIGFLNPLLYSQFGPNSVLTDITTGNNAQYQAAAGWDPCTGWGSPNGTNLLAALQGTATQAVVQQPTGDEADASANELLTPVEPAR